MSLDVDSDKKMLLLLGIGMFVDENTANLRYMEVMKRLATEQQLFMILASSDYIYGTNYQFCHGFIGKDLKEMTQQKTIQAMGRIGRNQTQQEYTIRFRDDACCINYSHLLLKTKRRWLCVDYFNEYYSNIVYPNNSKSRL